jgi:Pentapeptide repeats (8 copies)
MLRRAVALPIPPIAALAGGMGCILARSEVRCLPCQAPAAVRVRVTHPWTMANPTRDRDFRGGPFAQADFSGVVFDHCDFRDADLTGADLLGCRFFECDLTGARLADADLRGASFDDLTRWPEGFDPQAHGARLDQ